MGQHTWFFKDQEILKKEDEIERKLNAHDEGEIDLDYAELNRLEYELDSLLNVYEAEYHDLFRTIKRSEDGSYTDDIILSKDDCDKWLEENCHLVSWGDEEVYRKLLNEFWEKYPNGLIRFG
jgi:hypothetical protein